MRIFIITFRSVTFAQRGERLLNRNNHRCILQRTPKWMEQQGCGYSLRIKTEDIIPAAKTGQPHKQLPRRIMVCFRFPA